MENGSEDIREGSRNVDEQHSCDDDGGRKSRTRSGDTHRKEGENETEY